MSREQFSEQMGVTTRTVSTWLADGIVPGAQKRKVEGWAREVWRIPVKALKMKKPKVGRRRKNGKCP